jgi:peptide/nickel transport system substrate-binding protein
MGPGAGWRASRRGWRRFVSSVVGVLIVGAPVSTVTATVTTDVAEPQAGGTLRVAAAADAQPQFVMANRAGNWSWRRLVFESLVRIDGDGTPQPELVTAFTFDDSRTELTLELRGDVTFHSGRPMTADDIVFSLQQAAEPANASQLAGVAAMITSIEAVDEQTVLVVLQQPNDSIFDLLDLTPIVDQETFAGLADGSQVIGTGPFVWEEWVPGASIRLARNEDYRTPDRPYLDAVEVSILADSTALLSALRGGSAEIAIGMAQSDVALLSEDDAYALVEAGGVFYPFGLDVTQPPFDTPEARQALGYAFDRERISDQVFGGNAVITDLWWTPGSPGYPEALAGHFAYDPDRARQLLDASGAAGAALEVTYANLPVMHSLFEVVQNNLTEVGIDVTGNPLDVAEYDRRQVEGTLGQSFLLLHGMVGFSASTITMAMPSIRPGNPSKFDTPEYTALVADLAQAGEDERGAALTGLSEYMLDQSFSHVIVVAPQFHVRSVAVSDLGVFTLGSLVATDTFLVE